ncbi:MAG: sigma-70 family RNA polymerase sigma factor [Gammaproteobacteria bacterium]|nr:sigma-70 family RNA polymerase sigma factor [Gammaproteobacteria bacterium]
MTTDMPEQETNPHVIETLVANHRRFLDFLTSRVGGREAAEDILQTAFVKGVERGGSIRDDEKAVAWFYRLLRNALIDYYRRRDAETRGLGKFTALLESEPAAIEPELEETICMCVTDLVSTLKPEYAEMIRRVDLGGARVDVVAAESGMTPNNAAVRLHRARQALRERLAATCGTCAVHGCLDCSCGQPRAH